MENEEIFYIMALISDFLFYIEQAEKAVNSVQHMSRNELIRRAFYGCFEYRFCWSSNSLEGNTLSLDETIAVVDYDEVSSGHTYSEYKDAKNLYKTIKEALSASPIMISEDWIRRVNGIICGTDGAYRAEDVYIGSATDAVYFPPRFTDVPERMRDYIEKINSLRFYGFAEAVKGIAESHILFERIHPFADGNGRTGRIIMNQMLMNSGILPVAISRKSKYRQAFRAYDRNHDISILAVLLCDALKESAQSLRECYAKYERDQKNEGGRFPC
jgi:Fic family protein